MLSEWVEYRAHTNCEMVNQAQRQRTGITCQVSKPVLMPLPIEQPCNSTHTKVYEIVPAIPSQNSSHLTQQRPAGKKRGAHKLFGRVLLALPEASNAKMADIAMIAASLVEVACQ